MVCVWPPHTSMNLNASSPASAVICATNAPAVVGSLYSSTNRIGQGLLLPLMSPSPLLGHRAQTGRVVWGTEDGGDDLDPLLEEIAGNGQRPVSEVPDLPRGGDGVPGLLDLRPPFRTCSAAERVADHDADD